MSGKIAYIEKSSNKTFMVENGVHEIGHNLGLDHQKITGKYLSYDKSRNHFSSLQKITIYNHAATGSLNKGGNSERLITSSTNFSSVTTNDRPYQTETKNQRIPLRIHNPY